MLGLFLCPLSVQAKEQYTLSQEIEEYCEYYGSQYGISPEMLEAIIWTESRGSKYAVNSTCIGISQINTTSQSERLEQSMKATNIYDKYDYRVQIRTMCSLLNELLWISADENEDVCYVLGAYHGELSARENSETGDVSDYVDNILDLTRELEIEHGKVEVME